MTETTTAPVCREACDACELVGLAIQPLRYALAWDGEDVPTISARPRSRAISAPHTRRWATLQPTTLCAYCALVTFTCSMNKPMNGQPTR